VPVRPEHTPPRRERKDGGKKGSGEGKKSGPTEKTTRALPGEAHRQGEMAKKIHKSIKEDRGGCVGNYQGPA